MGFRYTAHLRSTCSSASSWPMMLGIGWSDWGRTQWRVLAEDYSDFVLLAVGRWCCTCWSS